eukprot:TRINITY_DN66573_c0_g1_i1.p1 TRINITY_DN66573_c0_g1~~TRINITY_DN66573_c0_g1_i1.p1  ORF type:complete len:591 (-),score=90.40 TRINITY_DN66573_c0_g1_i1:56-1828(-)
MSDLRQRRGGSSDKEGACGRPDDSDACAADAAAAVDAEQESGRIFWLAFVLLAAVRILAGLLTMIADCDETFNYWEPLHFITFGRGFQTWEYSPVFALRSYLFLLPHAAVARTAALIAGRPAAFFATRCVQGCASAAAEAAFVAALRQRFGREVAQGTLVLLAASPGMWSAGVAFLPSSVAMTLVCAVWALWLRGRWHVAIFLGVGTVIVVWPFTGLLFIPFGLHALGALGLVRGLGSAAASVIFWSVLSLAVDSSFYGRTVLPAFEIFRYNVLDRGRTGGSELYGVEPWHFYFVNGLLNLNLALLASLVFPCVAVLRYVCSGHKLSSSIRSQPLWALLYSAAAFVWFSFFSLIPHKEERFLAPAYPILLFAAAAAAHYGSQLLESAVRRVSTTLARLMLRLRVLFLALALLLSLSRILALQTGYSAPLAVYRALSDELVTARASKTRGTEAIHVCIGAEWYRFATSFFLPHDNDHLSYVRFGPTGLLPAQWNSTLGTSGVPPNMNDQNKEEESRYIQPNLCDYFIDFQAGDGLGDVPHLRSLAWDRVADAPFLDQARSRQPWRAFYVPGISARRNAYSSYVALRRRAEP